MTSELAGIRKYLKRTKTLSQLEVLSNDLYAIADSEVIITNAGFEGGSTRRAKRASIPRATFSTSSKT
jgi:hypothetical protein